VGASKGELRREKSDWYLVDGISQGGSDRVGNRKEFLGIPRKVLVLAPFDASSFFPTRNEQEETFEHLLPTSARRRREFTITEDEERERNGGDRSGSAVIKSGLDGVAFHKFVR